MVRRGRRRGLGSSGVGEGGGDRDPRRRHRADPGAAAGRAGRCAGLAALWRGCRGLCGLHADAALDLCRRGLRRDRPAGREMVARLIAAGG